MPHYDYHCQQCGHQLKNIFQKMTDEPLKECPECHQKTLRRGPGGGSGLIFKGSGFYITDYGHQGQSTSGEGSGAKSDNHKSSCCPCGKSSCS